MALEVCRASDKRCLPPNSCMSNERLGFKSSQLEPLFHRVSEEVENSYAFEMKDGQCTIDRTYEKSKTRVQHQQGATEWGTVGGVMAWL